MHAHPREVGRARGAVGGIALVAGLYDGLAPFASRLLLDGDLLLALPLRLPAPWWWVTSIAVLVATVVALVLLERRGDGDSSA